MRKYGRLNHIKVSGVSDALESISNTIEVSGKPSQLLYRVGFVTCFQLDRVDWVFQTPQWYWI